ncbi:MAG: hypothetical protein FJY29_10925 [Betaproteobacteria bacterium]|nr:hypothetical protein [Betaproteobacteria bacterium]
MELTNLLWHLGALVAALWAGFSYRALLARQQELEAGVVVSLLLSKAEVPLPEAPRPSPRHLAALRSSRVRALAWFADEFERRYSCSVVWKNRESLLELTDEHWRNALAALYELLMHPEPIVVKRGKQSVLDWQQQVSAGGHWTVVSEKGEN